jgi:hypothetical protein
MYVGTKEVSKRFFVMSEKAIEKERWVLPGEIIEFLDVDPPGRQNIKIVETGEILNLDLATTGKSYFK